jgi:hypothetical protein
VDFDDSGYENPGKSTHRNLGGEAILFISIAGGLAMTRLAGMNSSLLILPGIFPCLAAD